jgi:pimeloyl-ACP methyl ester carboxylesterase
MMGGAVFEPIVGPLCELGRLTIPDLRGAGASSEGEDYSLEGYASDVIKVLDEVGPSTVLGHSMGGAIAQLVAVDRPDLVERLILVNPVPAAGLPLPEEAMGLFSTSAGDRDKQAIILGMACLQLADEERDRLLDVAATVKAQAIVDSLAAWTAGGFADRLGEVSAPTHVIATSDPFLPPAFLQAAVVDLIDGAELHVLEGPGHYPMCEDPDALMVHLRQILAPQ